MSWKMFGQIVLLIIIAITLVVLAKCTMRKCPIMGKYLKMSCPMNAVSK